MKFRKIVRYVFFDASVRNAMVILCPSNLLTASPAASIVLHSSSRWKTEIQTGRASTDAMIGVLIGIQIGVPIRIV
jgi:hypothetical protein